MKQKLSSCCLLLMAMLLVVTTTWAKSPPKKPISLVASKLNGPPSSTPGGLFTPPTNITGNTPSGIAWSTVATGTSLPIRSSSVTADGLPGAVAYYNIVTGELSIDPKGLNISLFNFTYTHGSSNISGTGPTGSGPLMFSCGYQTNTQGWTPTCSPNSGNVSGTTGLANVQTFPAGTWTLMTFLPARMAATVSLTGTATLSTNGDPANIGSTNGWFDKPWSFGNVVKADSLAAIKDSCWKVFGVSGNANANILGYGNYKSCFQYTVNGIVGNQVGAVIPYVGSICTPTTSTTTLTNCGAYTWNGQTYDASGTYTYTTTNAAGCDSTATLNLTISKPAGAEWTLQTYANPDEIEFGGVAYGNGKFVVLKNFGNGGVMTSTDGINWTDRLTPDNSRTFWDIVYGNGLFVAIAKFGTQAVMTSTDGITWTFQSTPNPPGLWYSITYGNGMFVVVGNVGRSMYSTDGINWSLGNTPDNLSDFNGVAYGNGLFVAVGSRGTNRVMTSSDGINWTYKTAAENNFWTSVTYGNGLFVAVADGGTNRVMTSADGTNWTASSVPAIFWNDIIFADQKFVAVGDGATIRVMSSTDGINWTSVDAHQKGWSRVAYGNGRFVATSYDATDDNIMTSIAGVGCAPACTPTTSTTTITNCGAYTWNGQTYNASGTYTWTGTNAAGCDSTATLNLTVTYDAASLTIGANFQGGKIGYILQDGDPGYDATKVKGLVIAANDYAPKPWAIGSYTTTTTGVTNTAIGTGAANTTALVNLMGPGDYVAYQIDTLTLGGFTDWYLPSQDEISKILPNYASLNISAIPVGPGLQTYWYASSTESAADQFKRVYFFTFTNATGTNTQTKGGSGSGPSRPVRSFEVTACAPACVPTSSTTTVTSRGLYGCLGVDYTASGTYKDTLVNAAGCDSIATLNLTILPAITTDTVRIGNQTWTTKNLSISHYRNGDPIPEVTDKATWDNLTTGAWSWYNNDSATYSSYGKLYNWYALNDPRGFAPANYRLPSIVEYNTLRETTDKLIEFAEPGINKWNYEVGATNISGFGVYPLGLRNGTPWASPDFNPNGESVDMWTGTEYPFSQDSAIQAQLRYDTDLDSLQYDAMVTSKRAGLTVRLLYVPCSNSSSTTTVTSRGLYGWNGVDYTATGTYQKILVNATGCDSIATLNLTILPAITADTVRIYNQTWTTKNLDVTRYRNGDVIPQVTDSTTWQNLTTGAWCWYNNDSTNYAQYGRLYNKYAVNDSRGFAPKGYHVPTMNEVIELGSNFPENANELIAPGINIWDAPSSPGTNISGLAIYPTGGRIGSGNINDFGENKKIGAFWLTDEYGGPLATGGYFFYDSAKYKASPNLYLKQYGLPVRLIKDPCSPNSSDTTVSACFSFSWNGQTFTSSGIYKDTLTNAGGCDSIATLNLTITEKPRWYRDSDGDTYGDPNNSTLDCDQPEGYVSNSRDCNDSNNQVGVKYWYKDKDGDGHGSRRNEDRRESCSKPQKDGILPGAGEYVENADDCDDDDATIGNTVWYKDADSDGYGTGDSIYVCDQPTGYRLLKDMTAATGDCDDTNANIRPNSSTAATSATSSVINPAPGTSLKLRQIGGVLGANDTWKWYTSSCGGTLVGTGDSITVAPTVTTTYYVRAEGCTNTNCVSVTVTICGPTGVTSKAANNTICQGSSVEMNVQGSLVGSAKWVWYKTACGYNPSSGSSEGAIGTGATLKVTPTSTTTYFVRSEGGSCGNTICKSITITVNPKPAKPTSVTVPSKICKQSTIQLTVGDVKNATSYKWTVPSGWSIVSGQNTKTITVKTGNLSGDVKVAAVNSCGTSDTYTKKVTLGSCSGGSSSVVVTTVSKVQVNAQEESNGVIDINAYPNPTANYFTIRNTNAFTIQLRMMHTTGQVVETYAQVQPGASVRFGAGYQPGMYLVEAFGNGMKTTKKLIKQ